MKNKKSVRKKTKLSYFQFAIKVVLGFLTVLFIFILSVYLGAWGPIPKKRSYQIST
ncbi:MAG: hypothetical protein ACJAWH_002267, partial [Maribacter sp.]